MKPIHYLVISTTYDSTRTELEGCSQQNDPYGTGLYNLVQKREGRSRTVWEIGDTGGAIERNGRQSPRYATPWLVAGERGITNLEAKILYPAK
jgi:hypothetical protein